MLGVWLVAASAIDPAAIRLRYPLPAATAFAAASLIIAADGLFCAGLVARAHERRHHDPNAGRVAAWMQPVVNAVLALLASCACVLAWRAEPVLLGHDMRLVSGFILVLGAFPVLVLERTFAGRAAWELAFMLRVPLVALLGVGITEFLLAADFAWPGAIEQAVGILVLLVSIELLLRSFATAFTPPPPVEDLRPIACSVLARAIQPVRPNLFGLNAVLERQVGIDLQRSWALGFAARAAVPIAFGNRRPRLGRDRADGAADGPARGV